MSLARKLINARKLKGLTQEELAEISGVTSRTIQRIEVGETVPRSFTIRRIADALELNLEDLLEQNTDNPAPQPDPETVKARNSRLIDEQHFLQLLCLSSFSYLVIPYVHFLIPMRMLRKRNDITEGGYAFGRNLIKAQVIWVVLLNLSLLVSLFINLSVARGAGSFQISYLTVVAILYLANAAVLAIFIRYAFRFKHSGQAAV